MVWIIYTQRKIFVRISRVKRSYAHQFCLRNIKIFCIHPTWIARIGSGERKHRIYPYAFVCLDATQHIHCVASDAPSPFIQVDIARPMETCRDIIDHYFTQDSIGWCLRSCWRAGGRWSERCSDGGRWGWRLRQSAGHRWGRRRRCNHRHLARRDDGGFDRG